MLKLAMVNEGILLKVSLNFKNIVLKKNQLNSHKNDVKESDIVIGKTVFSTVSDNYCAKYDPNYLTGYIRKCVNYSNRQIDYIAVNTKMNNDFYDTYLLPLPNNQENYAIDYLYGSLINNIRFSDPDNIKEVDVNLKKLGIDKLFDQQVLSNVLKVKKEYHDYREVKNQLIYDGYGKQVEIIDFLNNLDYKISDDNFLPKVYFDKTLAFFEDDKKPYKCLNNYLKTAEDNYDSYLSLAIFNNLVYNEPLKWHNLSVSQQKSLLKRNNNG